MITLNYDDWFEKYKPIKNTITKNSSYGGTMFETFGDDLDFIKSQLNNQIWTLLSVEDEEFWIIPGFHWVNRMGCFVTEIPWELKNIQVNDNEMCTIEEAIEHCIVFASKEFGIELNWNDVNKHFQKNLDITFNNEMTIGRAKYTAIAYYEDSLNKEMKEFEDKIHDYYSQL
jgi:hypothetical protein